jgi:hypothetical protein
VLLWNLIIAEPPAEWDQATSRCISSDDGWSAPFGLGVRVASSSRSGVSNAGSMGQNRKAVNASRIIKGMLRAAILAPAATVSRPNGVARITQGRRKN